MPQFISITLFLVFALQGICSAQNQCAPGAAKTRLDNGLVSAELNTSSWLFQNDYSLTSSNGATLASGLGIWVAGQVGGEHRSAISTSSGSEWWPGPTSAILAGEDCSDYDRIYSLKREDFDRALNESIFSQDVLDWPWQHGAPITHGDSDSTSYDLNAGDLPALVGYQTAWWVMNDVGGEHALSQSEALGIELQITAISVHFPIPLSESTYYKVKLVNRSGQKIDSVIVGLQLDAALGNPFDNYAGSDPFIMMSYFYNADDDDENLRDESGMWTGFGQRPPAFGLNVIQGPIVDRDGVDNDEDGRVDEYNERSLASRLYSTPFNELLCPDGDCSLSPEQVWFHLQGKDSTGTFYDELNECALRPRPRCPHWGDGSIRFPFPGDPPHFWSEENIDDSGTRNLSGHRSSMTVIGPMDLEPGEEQEIIFALLAAEGNDRLDSVRELKETALYLRGGFSAGAFLLPVITSTETEEIGKADTPSIFPNPVAGDFTLKLATQPFEPLHWTLFDLNGREIEKGIQNSLIENIELDLISGIYLLKVDSFDPIKLVKL